MTEPGRTRWPDERIDDLGLSLREEIRDLRAEMRDGFRELRADNRALQAEVGLSRRWITQMWVTTVLGFVSVLIAVSIR